MANAWEPTDVLTVSDLTTVVKSVLETTFSTLLVVGEISNYKQHTSGHRYFTLKDGDASIACVMWKTRPLDFVPTDGMQVVVGGRLTVYAARGTYQLDCAYIRPHGIGDLYRAYEKLKTDLAARGWFRREIKKPLPRFPRTIGVITSATGAVIRDIRVTIERRFPGVEILLRPTQMQGDGSAQDVAQAIRQVDALHPDVIIVARGGGSIEDLWSFNTETVAAAIFECVTPIISAIGHETDETIADFVADRRAPTPTAAGELVTPLTSEELIRRIDDLELDITDTITSTIQQFSELINDFTSGGALLRIRERLSVLNQRIISQYQRMTASVTGTLNLNIVMLDHYTSALTMLHPHRPLRLGYAILERDNVPVPTSHVLQEGETLTIVRWTDRSAITVNSVTSNERTNHG